MLKTLRCYFVLLNRLTDDVTLVAGGSDGVLTGMNDGSFGGQVPSVTPRKNELVLRGVIAR